jgi:hypothetical protein
MILAPVWTAPSEVDAALAERGHAVLSPAGISGLLGAPLEALAAWPAYWNDLPPDTYLRDGGRYRRRRHGCYIVDGDEVTAAPHRAHWQPVDYNALHGGIERHFEPLAAGFAQHPRWPDWLRMLAGRASALLGATRWYVEAHPFRIDTTDGIGRPTPEGAHRDGVNLVAVTLISRHSVKGGETRVFEAHGHRGFRFTLTEPWSTLLLDDPRVIHETTPIQPMEAGRIGHRDTLVITLRAGGFQGP